MNGRKSVQPIRAEKIVENEYLTKFAQDTKKNLKNKY